MGTDRPAGRHSSTMRRAIGARTPSVEVPPLRELHQYWYWSNNSVFGPQVLRVTPSAHSL